MFKHLISKSVEVYVDDMVVKSPTPTQHSKDLSNVFSTLREYNLCLNLKKCVFRVDKGKFLWFMLTHRGIKLNHEKCQIVFSMRSLKNVKEV